MFETSVVIYTENSAVILRSVRTVVSIQYWHVTDRQTDRQTGRQTQQYCQLQFHYSTGKHKMFNVIVTAKLSTRAKIALNTRNCSL